MNDISRRGILAAGWSVPAVTVVASAPAFAASDTALVCVPVGLKFPGESWGSRLKHSYGLVSLNCNQKVEITSVTFSESAGGTSHAGVFEHGTWLFHSDDSRSKLWVRVFTAAGLAWEGEVKFPPAQGHV